MSDARKARFAREAAARCGDARLIGYTTEIVIAGMGGTLTMLDGPTGGGGSTRHDNQNGQGSDWSPPPESQDGGRPPFDDDLDDEVRF